MAKWRRSLRAVRTLFCHANLPKVYNSKGESMTAGKTWCLVRPWWPGNKKALSGLTQHRLNRLPDLRKQDRQARDRAEHFPAGQHQLHRHFVHFVHCLQGKLASMDWLSTLGLKLGRKLQSITRHLWHLWHLTSDPRAGTRLDLLRLCTGGVVW